MANDNIIDLTLSSSSSSDDEITEISLLPKRRKLESSVVLGVVDLTSEFETASPVKVDLKDKEEKLNCEPASEKFENDLNWDIVERRYKSFVCLGQPSLKFGNLLKPAEALDLLLNLSSSSELVSSLKPVGVQQPSVFVVPDTALGHKEDIKADDLGVWMHKGKPVRKYEVTREEISGGVYGVSLTKAGGKNVHTLTRVYYHHKYTPSFRRTLFYATGDDGKKIPLTIVQNSFFDGIVVPIKMAPHGNCTKTTNPYLRTQSSTLESIKENLPSMQPKQIVNESYKKVGGVLQMKSSGEVTRNLRQVYNIKAYQGCTSKLASNCEKDLVYDLLEQHYSSEQNFVHSVSFEEGVMSVVSTEQQFTDVTRFCSGVDPVNASVLGIDPTFNLGDFYVTPTVFEHKLVKNKVTGKHPIFLGPTMIHQDRKNGTYSYFASQIRKIRPEMEGLVAFGTDGEEALSSAFSTVFPQSTHLLCSIHKRDNIRRKLREFGIKECSAKSLLDDVFENGNVGLVGLVDSEDCSDFTVKLEALKEKWDSVCPEFFPWFVKNKVEPICASMLSSVRTQSGLGKPPKVFTTNSSESLNNLLKRRVDFKRSEWPQFNRVLKALAEEQQAEFEKAIFGGGEYELIKEYKHLQVPHSDWVQMTADQRKLKLKAAKQVTLSSLSISRPSTSVTEENQPSRTLSVNLGQAKVEHVSKERMASMWEKASLLLSTPNLVLPAAGAAFTARQVASLSLYNSGKIDPPHYVCMLKRKIGVEVKCDCSVFRSTPNICQHALATAEDLNCLTEYLLWVRKTKRSANLSRLTSDAIPNNGGQKSTSRRKGGPRRTLTNKNPMTICVSSPSNLSSPPSSCSTHSNQLPNFGTPSNPPSSFSGPSFSTPKPNDPIPPMFNTPLNPHTSLSNLYSLSPSQPGCSNPRLNQLQLPCFNEYPNANNSFCSPSYQLHSSVYLDTQHSGQSSTASNCSGENPPKLMCYNNSLDPELECAMAVQNPFVQIRV